VVAAALGREAEPSSTAAASHLQVYHVSHGFALRGADLPVLEDVSLEVAPGEFVALLGPSGCGKSTLLRLVAGLEVPRAGQIFDSGALVAAPDPSRVIMFQDPTLYPWRTVRANAALGLEARGQLRGPGRHAAGERISAALKLVGLDNFAGAYPHQISGGMAQRAALARALVNEPRLLILDEPLGKLDSLTRLTLQQELVALWQRGGFSALMVTHDVEEALLMANRIVVFSDRPAHILATLEVTLPYPRHRDDAELVALRRHVLGLLGLAA
jgi:NitT/TauT family transport system ATP-binding protein